MFAAHPPFTLALLMLLPSDRVRPAPDVTAMTAIADRVVAATDVTAMTAITDRVVAVTDVTAMTAMAGSKRLPVLSASPLLPIQS